MRYHEGRCSTHPTTSGAIGDTTVCDGSCLNEMCDDCGAGTGESCSVDCPGLRSDDGPLAVTGSDWINDKTHGLRGEHPWIPGAVFASHPVWRSTWRRRRSGSWQVIGDGVQRG